MDAAGSARPLPRGLRLYLAALCVLAAAFVATAPWRFGGREIGRLAVLWGALALLGGIALLRRDWRAPLLERFEFREIRFRRAAVLGAGLLAAAFLLRIVVGRYVSLDLNAWDTTLSFDRPIASTLAGRLLLSPDTGTSSLGTHASYVLLAFVPLYFVAPTPLWLLAAVGLAISGAAVVAFLLFRRVLADDLAGAFLAAAFVLNTYTAKTVQYGFHVEVFYPLAVFLLFLGLLEERIALLAAGVLLAILVKEDSVLLLSGFAAFAAVTRRYRAAAAVVAAGIASYLVASRLVMPHFSGAAAEHPWYAVYWSSWGDSLPSIALSMLRHPGRLAAAVGRSGVPRLLETLLFLPLAGPEGLGAAVPAILPFAAADYRPLRELTLYYSMPVLPFLFVGAGFGMTRIASLVSRFRFPGPNRKPETRNQKPETRTTTRLLALAVCLICALDGPGYTLTRPSPACGEIDPTLRIAGDAPVRIQGSLYPHAGYSPNRRALDRRPLAADEAVLLAPDTNPYPFRASELSELAARLSSNPRYRRVATPAGLLLFLPQVNRETHARSDAVVAR